MSLKLLFLPLSVVVSLCVFIWVTKPAYDESKLKKIELTKKEAELTTLSTKEAALNKVISEYENLSNADSSLIFSLLPVNIETDDFIAEFSDKAKEAGIVLNKVGASEVKEMGSTAKQMQSVGIDEGALDDSFNPVMVRSIEIKSSIFGNYDGFRKFISLIEGMKRYIDVGELKIKKIESEENAGQHDLIEADINFKIYTLAEDAKIKIASKTSESDPVVSNLFSGSFSNEALEESRGYVKSSFQFVPSVDGLGKENIFFW